MTQVFIFANQAPAGELAGLLAWEAELEVLGWETDIEAVGQRIQEIRPAAVIVAHEGATGDCAPAVRRVSQECPGIRVVDIDLKTGVLQVYGEEPAMLEAVRQLVSAIQLRSDLASHR